MRKFDFMRVLVILVLFRKGIMHSGLNRGDFCNRYYCIFLFNIGIFSVIRRLI